MKRKVSKGNLRCKLASLPIEQNHMMSYDEKSLKTDKAQYQRLMEKIDLFGTH